MVGQTCVYFHAAIFLKGYCFSWARKTGPANFDDPGKRAQFSLLVAEQQNSELWILCLNALISVFLFIKTVSSWQCELFFGLTIVISSFRHPLSLMSRSKMFNSKIRPTLFCLNSVNLNAVKLRSFPIKTFLPHTGLNRIFNKYLPLKTFRIPDAAARFYERYVLKGAELFNVYLRQN